MYIIIDMRIIIIDMVICDTPTWQVIMINAHEHFKYCAHTFIKYIVGAYFSSFSM